MSIFDDIERDAKAGTPGDWSVCEYDAGNILWWSGLPSVQANEEQDCAIVHWDGFVQEFWRSPNGDKQIQANARRIARVPQIERIALAAKMLAEIIDMPVQSHGDLGRYHYDWVVIDAALAAFREAAE